MVAVRGTLIIQHREAGDLDNPTQRGNKGTVRLSDYGRFHGIVYNSGHVSECGQTINDVGLSRILSGM